MLTSYFIYALRIMNDYVLDNIVALLRTLKNIPQIFRHTFKRLLKSLWLVLFLNSNSRNIRNLANENEADPAGEFFIASQSWLALP
jgi:hypothetical protein